MHRYVFRMTNLLYLHLVCCEDASTNSLLQENAALLKHADTYLLSHFIARRWDVFLHNISYSSTSGSSLDVYFRLRFRRKIAHLTTLPAILKKLFGGLYKVISYQIQFVGYRHAICRIYA
jgi:hypothetical protein